MDSDGARTPDAIRAMHSVEDRVVIVTGAGQGVGRGMANHLAKAGAAVVVAEWNAEKMRRTVAELDVGAVAHFLCTDACRYLTGQTLMVDRGTFLWA